MSVDSVILERLIDEAGIVHRKNSRSFIMDCPKCGKKDKLYIRRSDGRFTCWVCRETDNYHGKPEYVLSDLLGMTVPEARERLYGAGHVQSTVWLDVKIIDFFGEDDEVPEDLPVPIQEINWDPDTYEIDELQATRGASYLESRGIPMAIAKEYGLMYIPQRQRVAFPIRDQGRLVGWQARLIVPNQFYDSRSGTMYTIPKILSNTNIPRDRTLMFSDRLDGSDHAVLCEGPVDAIKAHLCGGNVSAMGKAVTRAQVALLRNGGIRDLYLALDPDAADETTRLVRDLYGEMNCYLLEAPSKTTPEGLKMKNDLGAMSFEEVYDLYRHAPLITPATLIVFMKEYNFSACGAQLARL